jgi:hypothetical protein
MTTESAVEYTVVDGNGLSRMDGEQVRETREYMLLHSEAIEVHFDIPGMFTIWSWRSAAMGTNPIIYIRSDLLEARK